MNALDNVYIRPKRTFTDCQIQILLGHSVTKQ